MSEGDAHLEGNAALLPAHSQVAAKYAGVHLDRESCKRWILRVMMTWMAMESCALITKISVQHKKVSWLVFTCISNNSKKAI